MDKWGARPARDVPHQDDRPHESSRETPDAHDRFEFATATATVRRRIPLSSVPVIRLEAGLPPPASRVAEGSSVDLFRAFAGTAIPVEVRLRRDPAPSADQVSDVVAWLRSHRVRETGTPLPLPAPPPIPPPPVALAPLHTAELPRRGAVWPLFAVSVGLAAAMLAAFIL